MNKKITLIILLIVVLLVVTLNLYYTNIKFNTKGFAGITKGGEEHFKHSYIQVYTAKDLETALKIKKDVVIEIMNDLDLGYNKIKDEINCENIKPHNEPKSHPILKETGISKIIFNNISNVTIYSKNNSKILHATLELENAYNVNINNLSFDELWEWDDTGKYDENDWDYIQIVSAEKLWIHDCIFEQAYDGIIDVKNGKDITISYCKLIPNENEEFFKLQFDYLEKNIDYFNVYKKLRIECLHTKEDIEEIFNNQYKGFCFGSIENNPSNKEITITMHDNYLKNIKTRAPRLRAGKLHFYNNVIDDNELKTNDIIFSETGYSMPEDARTIIVSENGQAIVENCLFLEIKEPFRNFAQLDERNNPKGKIRIIDSIIKFKEKTSQIGTKDIGNMQDFDIPQSIFYKYEKRKFNFFS